MNRCITTFLLLAAMTLTAMPFGSTLKNTTPHNVSPMSESFVPTEDCFAANPAAGNTNKLDHAAWARNQTVDTLVNDLWAKIVMVYGCTIVSGDQAAQLFGELSGLIARRANDARCFNGDRGAINTDDAAHERWARTKTRTEVRDNLGAKAAAALRCLDAGHNRVDFFATASMYLAMSPTRSGHGINCNNGQYALAGVAPQRAGTGFSITFSAPANHSERDWIGIFPDGVLPAESRTVGWQWVPKGCNGYVVLKAPTTPGKYYIYYLQNGGFTPIGGGVALTVFQ